MVFQRVSTMEDLWSGEMLACAVAGRRVVLIRVGDAVYAHEDRCAHLGVALSQGRLEEGVLTCAAHHYQYDACTGQGINPRSVRLRTFAVRIEQGDILVDTGEEGENG
jgi:toluene monooxygenase system ferredoxin subunit